MWIYCLVAENKHFGLYQKSWIKLNIAKILLIITTSRFVYLAEKQLDVYIL